MLTAGVFQAPSAHADLKKWIQKKAEQVRSVTEAVRAPERSPNQAPDSQTVPKVSSRQAGSELNRSQIRELQNRLKQLGYNLGAPDGIAGSHTREAIRSFQAAEGLVADGRPTIAVLKAAHTASPLPQESAQERRQPATVQSHTPPGAGGLLAPTVAGQAAGSVSAAGAVRITESVVVQGTELFRPLKMLTLDGTPLFRLDSSGSPTATDEYLVLLLIGVDPKKDDWFTYTTNVEIAAVRPDRIAEFGKCSSRRGRPASCSLTGGEARSDEFAQRRALAKYQSEVVPKFQEFKTQAPTTFYLASSTNLGRYDFSAQQQAIFAANNHLRRWGYRLPDSLPMSPEAAEQLRVEMTRGVSKADALVSRAGSSIHWLVEMTVSDRGIAQTSEIQYYLTDRYERQIGAVSLVSDEQRKALLVAEERAAEASAEQARAAAAAEESQAKNQRLAEFPQRSLDVVGVRLGATIAAAKAALEGKGFSVELLPRRSVLDKLQGPACHRQAATWKTEAISSGLSGAAVEAYLVARIDQLHPRCIELMKTIFEVALIASKTYSPNLSEKVTVHIAAQDTEADTVVAVTRLMNDRNKEVEFYSRVREKIPGEPVSRRGSHDLWFDQGVNHYAALDDQDFRKACYNSSGWPIGLTNGVLQPGPFNKDCGQILIAQRPVGRTPDMHWLVLVDSGYVASVKKQKLAAAERKKAAQPKVEF